MRAAPHVTAAAGRCGAAAPQGSTNLEATCRVCAARAPPPGSAPLNWQRCQQHPAQRPSLRHSPPIECGQGAAVYLPSGASRAGPPTGWYGVHEVDWWPHSQQRSAKAPDPTTETARSPSCCCLSASRAPALLLLLLLRLSSSSPPRQPTRHLSPTSNPPSPLLRSTLWHGRILFPGALRHDKLPLCSTRLCFLSRVVPVTLARSHSSLPPLLPIASSGAASQTPSHRRLLENLRLLQLLLGRASLPHAAVQIATLPSPHAGPPTVFNGTPFAAPILESPRDEFAIPTVLRVLWDLWPPRAEHQIPPQAPVGQVDAQRLAVVGTARRPRRHPPQPETQARTGRRPRQNPPH